MNMYFIALVCPEEINARVLKWKTWMKQHFGCEAALRSPAHITLVPPCWMKQELETSLLDSLTSFTRTKQRINIQLRGFSGFTPKVIFVHVVQNDALDNLHKDLLTHLLSREIYPFTKDERAFHPHVTIATRDLHK